MKKLLILFMISVFLLTGCVPEGQKDAKPVIYLYPEKEQEVFVELDYKGELTCTYPEYKDGWRVVAHPDGTLVDEATGKEYSYLFWEGTSTTKYDLGKGYVIAGKDTAEFLEMKLAELGLTRSEANEFIVYWLPEMQENPYNLITFQNETYQNAATLKITPEPDSILCVFMAYKALEKPIEVEEPVMEPFERKGFTVVEWGGAKVE